MTYSQLNEILSEIHEKLGFIVDDDDIALWALLRSTTPKRARRAIEKVVADVSRTTILNRHNQMIELLQKRGIFVNR